MLQDLIHSLDPTRPVTCGMDRIGPVLENGFAAALDIPWDSTTNPSITTRLTACSRNGLS